MRGGEVLRVDPWRTSVSEGRGVVSKEGKAARDIGESGDGVPEDSKERPPPCHVPQSR